MEYKELIDAFAAKCGLERPDAKDGVVVFEIDGMNVELVNDVHEVIAGNKTINAKDLLK